MPMRLSIRASSRTPKLRSGRRPRPLRPRSTTAAASASAPMRTPMARPWPMPMPISTISASSRTPLPRREEGNVANALASITNSGAIGIVADAHAIAEDVILPSTEDVDCAAIRPAYATASIEDGIDQYRHSLMLTDTIFSVATPTLKSSAHLGDAAPRLSCSTPARSTLRHWRRRAAVSPVPMPRSTMKGSSKRRPRAPEPRLKPMSS